MSPDDPNYGMEPPAALPTPPSGIPAVTPHPLDLRRRSAFLMGSEPAFERAATGQRPTTYPFQVEPDEPGMETRFLYRDSAAAHDRYTEDDTHTHRAAALARTSAAATAAAERAAQEAAQKAAERAAANALSASPVVALSPTHSAARKTRQRPVRHTSHLTEYIPALSGLRTLAVLAVCFYYATYWTGHFRLSYMGGIFDKIGSLGVSSFFILTGFLLFRQWLQPMVERPAQPLFAPRHLGRYLWSRFRRIVPAYWVTVFIVYGLYWLAIRTSGTSWVKGETTRQVGTTPLDFLRNLTFTQSYGLGHYHPAFTQSWAITVTFAFYLVFPFIAGGCFLLVNRKRFHALGTLLYLLPFFVITPLWDILTRNVQVVDFTSRTWLPSFLSWFVAGMMMAVLSIRIPKYSESAITGSSLVLSGVAFICYAAINILGDPTAVPSSFADTLGRWAFGMMVSCGVIVPLIFGNPQGDRLTRALHRFFGSRPMVAFSRISYEFFLLQILVLEFLMWVLGFPMFSGSLPLVFLLVVVVTTPLAWLLHKAIRWTLPRNPCHQASGASHGSRCHANSLK